MTTSAKRTRTHLLLLEDDLAQQIFLEHLLGEARAGVSVTLCQRLGEAVDHLAGGPPPDVVLSDLHVPDAQGVEIVERFRAVAPEVPLAILSTGQDDDAVAGLLAAGADRFLSKDELGVERLRDLLDALDRAGATTP